MELELSILFIMEMIGTIAFASSGAMGGIRKGLDLLGITVVGVTTAVGGGMIRDLILGNTPPVMFVKPIYAVVAVITVLTLFLIVKFHIRTEKILSSEKMDWIMNVIDAIGLGAFTVVGVNTALARYESWYMFAIFLGVLTGVGGGALRDMMLQEIPAVLKKHIYACASFAGALCYIWMVPLIGQNVALIISTLIVIVIRILARYYRWNLPKAV